MRQTDFDGFFGRLATATGIRSQSDLAKALGLGRASVSLAKGKNAVPARWILELAARFGLDPAWLSTGQGQARAAASPDEEFLRIPKVTARLCAGGGSFEAGGEVVGYYSFRSDWIRSRGDPSRMVLMGVVGNSMEPELKNGDMVLIDQSRTELVSGGIFAVGVEDTVMVKRLERLPGALVLRSDNPDYAPVALRGDELSNVRVIGRVLWAAREYRSM